MTTATLTIKDSMVEALQGRDCDYLEIRFEDTQRVDFIFRGPKLEDLNDTRSSGFAIRALVSGCWGFVTFNSIEELDSRIEEAIKAARLASRENSAPFKLAPVEPVNYEYRVTPIVDPRDIPLEDKLARFKAYNERILAGDGITTSMVYYFDTFSHIIFANSEGTVVEKERLDLACSIGAIASRNGDTRSARVSAGSTNDYSVTANLESKIDKALVDAVAKLDAPVIEAGTYTVVCDPNLAGVFVHEAFGHLSEGDNLADDDSMQEVLKLGRKFGGEFLNIYDTGLDVGLRGHVPVDDEGVPTERTVLIENGNLVGRLHNRETAGKLGEQATGNARAISYRFPPIPRMRNTCIAPGPHGDFDDLIKDITLGVYAIDSSGGQTNGELFTFTAADAFMIRDGKLAERVKDVTISGNVFDTLANIDAISSDYAVHDSAGGCGKGGQMPLPVSHGSPHIRIKGCVIGGK